MGGRGASSSLKNAQYNEGYKSATENDDFYASFALGNYMTRQQMAKEMVDYKDVLGKSLIQDLKADISSIKETIRDLKGLIKYGSPRGIEVTHDTINGEIAGYKENIKKREKALRILEGLKSEYQAEQSAKRKREEKAKKLGGNWL